MTVTIELTNALQIEALRSNGFTNDEILYKLKRQQLAAFQGKVANMEFDSLLSLFEKNPAQFERALRTGYKAETMTTEAAKFLLQCLFSAKEGDHFVIENGEIVIKRLTNKQREQFNEILPETWKSVVA
ncbi:hypothetical protein [Kurthia senegalensis]|uniref:hypothetical protein n=1 Tax=Kurthia senegalensis TaxID=1033740 RepID=UPI0002883B08|nr:hypothetical protein [Kurthia senegalensis]